MEVNLDTNDTSVYMNMKTFKRDPLEGSVFSIESSCRHVTLRRKKKLYCKIHANLSQLPNNKGLIIWIFSFRIEISTRYTELEKIAII